jgi:DNA-binding transcriptional LysR family regulator
MPRLPTPLANLEVFAEAGKTGSFKQAAGALSLTTSAVSQSIRKLEDRLGCDLFVRSNNKLSLTPAGALLLRHVKEGLDHIRQGLNAVVPEAARPLSFSSPPGIASQLLGPALVDLMSQHATDIRITADEAPDYRSHRNFDVAIIYGLGAQAVPDVESLGPDVFVPVCAPDLARRITSKSDLARHLLLSNETNAVSWEDWFEANAIIGENTRRLSYNRVHYIIPPLLQGAGIGLESLRLLSPQIARGELAVCDIRGTAPIVRNLTFLHVTQSETRRSRALEVAKLIRERCSTRSDGFLQDIDTR